MNLGEIQNMRSHRKLIRDYFESPVQPLLPFSLKLDETEVLDGEMRK